MLFRSKEKEKEKEEEGLTNAKSEYWDSMVSGFGSNDDLGDLFKKSSMSDMWKRSSLEYGDSINDMFKGSGVKSVGGSDMFRRSGSGKSVDSGDAMSGMFKK